MEIEISGPVGQADEGWLTALWRSEWTGDFMVSRSQIYHLKDLQTLLARVNEKPVGAATYHIEADGCELMSLNATEFGGGIGTKLLSAVEATAREAGCKRIWLITSNDNLDAMRFYQKRGYRFAAVHGGAIDEARKLKPTIPFRGCHGIEIHDEIELAKSLL